MENREVIRSVSEWKEETSTEVTPEKKRRKKSSVYFLPVLVSPRVLSEGMLGQKKVLIPRQARPSVDDSCQETVVVCCGYRVCLASPL